MKNEPDAIDGKSFEELVRGPSDEVIAAALHGGLGVPEQDVKDETRGTAQELLDRPSSKN